MALVKELCAVDPSAFDKGAALKGASFEVVKQSARLVCIHRLYGCLLSLTLLCTLPISNISTSSPAYLVCEVVTGG